ncbi:hypothetical protein Acid345_1724 [Candidatus Koribacter versatilis Ellin345]|uniref:Uncharacterized protein n=1 Tax=Koribacter versatilis (strain Ellin345) TaxID=204669 RepID=Q1IQX5_KORVE|nr:hypothetical protein [Candidatus Koribacter versatilis]ABF40725.1 hypothetical protein Acid345_1724 [Candidatus Koribacter versatilis Ellin345]
MKKKLAFSIVLLCLVGVSSFASAQNSAPEPKAATAEQLTDDAIKMMRQDIKSAKKQIVASNMTLTDTEATKFWPVYDRYIGEVAKINDTRYALIKEYADKYATMTDADANSFINRWLKADTDMSNLRIKWIPEFEKVVSPKKTAMFFQIDRRTNMIVELKLASQVPLMNQ